MLTQPAQFNWYCQLNIQWNDVVFKPMYPPSLILRVNKYTFQVIFICTGNKSKLEMSTWLKHRPNSTCLWFGCVILHGMAYLLLGGHGPLNDLSIFILLWLWLHALISLKGLCNLRLKSVHCNCFYLHLQPEKANIMSYMKVLVIAVILPNNFLSINE